MGETTADHQIDAPRVAALRSYGILDTEEEPAFDRLVEFAAALFEAPIALVSLVDETRQWFKARAGLDARETPRAWSFCSHAIDGGPWNTLVVERADRDPRFAANPLVTGEPGIRFYVGVALTSPEGHNLGTLCVIDTKARRRPSEAKLEQLRRLAAIVVDEIELRRTSRALLAHQQLLSMAQKMASLGVWRLDLTTGAIAWTDEVYAIHGLTRATFDPQVESAIDFYHPDDRALVREHLDRAISEGEGFSFQLRLRRQTGEDRIVQSRAEVEFGADGKPSFIHGVFQDITDSALALRRAQRSETRFRGLADSMADVVTRLRFDGSSDYISPAIEAVLGYRPREMAGLSSLHFVHEDDRRKVTAALRRIAAGRSKETLTHRAVHKSGRELWVETSFRRVEQDQDGPGEIVAVIRDISERHALEQALADSEAQLRVLAENSTDIMVRFGLDGLILHISPACRKLGVGPEEAIGKSIFNLVAPEHVEHSKALVAQLVRDLQAEPGRRREHLVVTKSGERLWLEGSPTIIFDGKGQPAEIVSVFRDVTERKATEAQLEQAKLAAEAAADAKAQFLANMSHELRTPLTAVVGFARLASAQPELSPTTKSYLDRLSIGATALMATINDILDFSKLEAGQVDIRPRPTDVGVLLRDCLSLFTAIADDKGTRLALRGAHCLPPKMLIDEDRVRQVLLNLIGNAVKFTADGDIDLIVDWDPAAKRLRCQVVDTGCGISQPQLAKLFRRFVQVDGTLSRGHGGTGLGLAICKGLVEAMGGEIGAISREDFGTTFEFWIPCEEISSPVGASEDAQVLDGSWRVLVADDHATNRELVRVVLGQFGIAVSEAEDGQQAVEMAQNEPFDLILMDLRMPKLSGVQAATSIRDGTGPNRDVSIIAFSADSETASNGDIFDGVVGKPLEPEVLIRTVSEALQAYGAQTEEAMVVDVRG